MHRLLRIATLLLLGTAGCGTLASTSSADLISRYQAGQQRRSQLGARIHSETARIQGFEGTIGSLQARLEAVQRSVAIQERLLGDVETQLASAHTRIARLRRAYARICRRWPRSCAPTTSRPRPRSSTSWWTPAASMISSTGSPR